MSTLSFSVFTNGKPAESLDLAGAYMVGGDDVALRAELSFKSGVITCRKRAAGPAGLALLWPVGPDRKVMLETARLIESDRPYVLQIEILRGRLTRISQKLEEWGFYEAADGGFIDRFNRVRDALIRALQADTPAQSAAIADEALVECIQMSEDLAVHHGQVLLERRLAGGMGRRVLGCGVDADQADETYRRRLAAAFDFAIVPCSWRAVEPAEQKFDWKPIDAWVEWLARKHMPIKATPLLSFAEHQLPDWIYIWEHDFETLRDLAHAHVKRVVSRYAQYVHYWDVACGLHADNALSFTFDQLIELTRMSAALVKQVAPRATSIVDIVAPWGEYYARNPRSIPPMLYAEMVAQSGVSVDAFGVQFQFGPDVDGMYVRDLFQVSTLLDRLGAMLSKPIHVTAVQVPSESRAAPDDAWGGQHDPRAGGAWRGPWSDASQAEWAEAFMRIALSKPFVETVAWARLADAPGHRVPFGGLLRRDQSPKPAYDRIIGLRESLSRAARA
ncbi:MAG: hypothetical protein C4547_15190 [Phycisphaerales bacterium]|nr:MAG: hypothetical protein C4547_15190 [Phycisphaerales bacterium]